LTAFTFVHGADLRARFRVLTELDGCHPCSFFCKIA